MISLKRLRIHLQPSNNKQVFFLFFTRLRNKDDDYLWMMITYDLPIPIYF